MSSPLFLLDVDGVLADFANPILQHANQVCLDRVPNFIPKKMADITDWAIEDLYPELTFDQVFAPARQKGFAYFLEPLPGAIEAVKELQSLGSVVVVTSPFRSAATWTSDRDSWLNSKFGIEHQDIIHCSNKALIPGDLLLDDKPENVEAWQKRWPGDVGLLWNAPYNQAELKRGRRVHSWEDVLKIARMLAAR